MAEGVSYLPPSQTWARTKRGERIKSGDDRLCAERDVDPSNQLESPVPGISRTTRGRRPNSRAASSSSGRAKGGIVHVRWGEAKQQRQADATRSGVCRR